MPRHFDVLWNPRSSGERSDLDLRLQLPFLWLNSIVSPGEEVIVIAPCFPEYRVWIDHAQAALRFWLTRKPFQLMLMLFVQLLRLRLAQ